VKTIFVSSYLFVRSQTSLDHLVLSSEARRYLTLIGQTDKISFDRLGLGVTRPILDLIAHFTIVFLGDATIGCEIADPALRFFGG
jgi:hypothetical protein